ncbi:MAG TPA: hypothetical protein VK459_14795, partial [Polyangiaceae bacterium]|nr:hypothetical protein [Polyangiaceae bacterium]
MKTMAAPIPRTDETGTWMGMLKGRPGTPAGTASSSEAPAALGAEVGGRAAALRSEGRGFGAGELWGLAGAAEGRGGSVERRSAVPGGAAKGQGVWRGGAGASVLGEEGGGSSPG